MAGKVKKNESEQGRRLTKLSVVIDAHLHAKLAAAAVLRGCSQSALAAEAIEQAVGSMVVFDRSLAKSPGRVNPTNEGIDADEAA